MGGFTVADDIKKRAGRGDYGDSLAFPHVHAQHKRSNSASDKNLSLSRGGVLNSVRKDLNELPELPPSARNCRAQTHLYEDVVDTHEDGASDHRASLEQDLSTPLNFTYANNSSLNISTLQIEQLQLRLQQEKSMRMLLERAMGRVSSTLSPGHRHVAAQTKELIAEIELLEVEVSNREQHVLSLYRSIFEHCVSRPLSEQSSSLTSPAHTKIESRRHPSVISRSFCSSKMLPLQPFQIEAAMKGKRNLMQSKKRHTSSFAGKADIHFENNCSDDTKGQDQLPIMGRTSVLRTLKDHLYECPSKLSEEMVRCMAAVYCWLRSSASSSPEQNRSPLLSRSSTNVILPRRGIIEDREWSCKSMIEVSWISTDKNNFSRASYAINNYRLLVEQLEKVHLNQMETSAQTAFWINMYNSLVMHAYLAYGIPHSSLRRLALFHKAAYNIGGQVISASAIEQSIFCFRTPRIGKWLETILSTALRKKSGEERQLISSKFSLQISQPLVCFALCTGAFSDPVLKVYTASNIQEELELAKKEFLQANIVVKKSKKVFLPKLLERFGKEASIASENLLKWVTENVDQKLRDSIEKCIECKNKKVSQIIEWLPYSSRFRYVFSKDLTEKPW
ncbi:hypothetical protein RJ640_012865 [Escallonia rubra]|uniref:Electron transporter n=1 Tax=Escallonia rubra TaxID=112253 RepID=A0AA88U8A1_9ASTE|nr:hypothetical protein RJ640_012865 [Escallonia rubra]